jgi:hypothetical protein
MTGGRQLAWPVGERQQWVESSYDRQVSSVRFDQLEPLGTTFFPKGFTVLGDQGCQIAIIRAGEYVHHLEQPHCLRIALGWGEIAACQEHRAHDRLLGHFDDIERVETEGTDTLGERIAFMLVKGAFVIGWPLLLAYCAIARITAPVD